MGTEVHRLFLMTNINNINDNNNIGVIIFNLKKVEISVKHKITPMSRFICLRHSTVVSFSSLTPPFVRYPEFSNGCYSTTRNQVTDVVRTGFEPVIEPPLPSTQRFPILGCGASNQFRHLTKVKLNKIWGTQLPFTPLVAYLSRFTPLLLGHRPFNSTPQR